MDEGIKEKFFSDLQHIFYQNPEVDGPIQDSENVGLKLKQKDTASEDIEDLSSYGDSSVGNRNMQHPIRLDAEDCWVFVRTGTCKFGRTCKFNHPVSTIVHVDRGKSNKIDAGSSSKSLSRIPCKFYPMGLCKYGESCRFNHSKSYLPRLNILGLPERLGKRECSFYMRTGICGYGTLCRFHHPQPIFFTVQYPIFFTVKSMDSHKEASEINDAGNVPHFSESTTSHVRMLKFGSIPSEFNVYQGKNGHLSKNGSTSESPSGDKTK